MTETKFHELVAAARSRYEAMSPEQKTAHDYAQRRSWVRGMCPDSQDYGEWCKIVDRLMPL